VSERGAQVERLLEVGRVDEASQLLEHALSSEPDSAQLRTLAARIAIARRDYASAREQIGAALDLAPRDYLARWLLYAIEHDEDRYSEAERVLIELIRDHPNDAFLLAEYADLMLLTLHLEKARQLVDESLRLDPEGEVGRRTDALLRLVEGDREGANERVQSLIRDDPKSRRTALTLYRHLIEQHRQREALDVAKQLLRANPSDEALIAAIVDLRAQTHWLALPIRPLQRFGWAGSAGIWLGFIVIANFARRTDAVWAGAILAAYLAWVVYSWTYMPIMTRWIRARGV